MIAANATSTSVQTVLVIAWRGKLGEKTLSTWKSCLYREYVLVPGLSVRASCASKNIKYKMF
jgi:hypothetical protein